MGFVTGGAGPGLESMDEATGNAEAGRCKLKPFEHRLESAWYRCLKPKYDDLRSFFCFQFQLPLLCGGDSDVSNERGRGW